MRPNTANLVPFTEEILNRKLYFLCCRMQPKFSKNQFLTQAFTFNTIGSKQQFYRTKQHPFGFPVTKVFSHIFLKKSCNLLMAKDSLGFEDNLGRVKHKTTISGSFWKHRFRCDDIIPQALYLQRLNLRRLYRGGEGRHFLESGKIFPAKKSLSYHFLNYLSILRHNQLFLV